MFRYLVSIFLFTLPALGQTTLDPEDIYQQLDPLAATDPHGWCSYRADVWAYQIEQITGITPKKTVLIYTKKFDVNDWSFHVAPSLKIGDTTWIFEKDHNGIHQALRVEEWMKKINGGKECKFISKADRRIRKSYKHSDKDGFSRDIIQSRHSCYLYEADVEFSGLDYGDIRGLRKNAENPNKLFNGSRVFSSCVQTILDHQTEDPKTQVITEDWRKLQNAREKCLKLLEPKSE